MGVGMSEYNCVAVTFHAIGCMLVLFTEKGILEEEQLGEGWDG